ncbi:AAA domain-containing protein [Catalinimonas alkaloidigena]|uniref:AAA domain-containing protein n=1 Tax=Catalinimonas alkaloidigena TaxID=1075417 RepID=A0A1G9AEI2_9BACT|nr:AAA family ATPase [Catalinimonas alkaloidigena]SDK25663.1 AAA domain-containing protein [Catalinimonas alkaloidigena]
MKEELENNNTENGNENSHSSATEANQQEIAVKKEEKKKPSLTIPANRMREVFKDRPKKRMVFSSIKEGSMGIIVGPSKSGKSTLIECLTLSLALQKEEFLGLPLLKYEKPPKILYACLEMMPEEVYEKIERQLEYLDATWDDLAENIIFISEEFPQYFTSEADWEKLETVIKENEIEILMIDSLTRLEGGEIEKSTVAGALMKHLRIIVKKYRLTGIFVHHTTKNVDELLSMKDAAGSRLVQQEPEFMLGITRTKEKKRFFQEVFSRHKRDSDDIIQFEINDNHWIEVQGVSSLTEINRRKDGRVDDTNAEKVLLYFQVNLEKEIKWKELKAEFEGEASEGKMSQGTLNKALEKLINWKKIERVSKGIYRMISIELEE